MSDSPHGVGATREQRGIMDDEVKVAVSRDGTSVSFAPTAGEMWGTSLFVLARAPKRLAVNFLLLPAILALVVTLVLGGDLAYGFVTFAAYLGAFSLSMLSGYFIRYQAKAEVRQWRTMWIGEEGIAAAVAHLTTEFRWQAFSRYYIHKDDLVLVYGKTTRFVLIPSRAFRTMEDAHRVKELVESKVGPDVQ
jgi:hypothetical protein